MKIISQIEATKIKQIGQGQGLNSSVFLCHDPQVDGEIVIKEIPLNKFKDPDEYFEEAKTLYKNKNPKVVPVMYACKDSDNIRIAMPYYRNGTLEDMLNNTYLTIRKIVNIAEQFLHGLHHIHSNDYIHYDLKPTNILFADDMTPLVSDFGQSRRTNNFGVGEIPPMYPSHIVPEFLTGTHSTKQSDIFQIGLTLYRMCNGNEHFKDQFQFSSQQRWFEAVKNGKFPSRGSYLAHIPLKMRRIVKTCLNVDPSKRYQTCIELLNELVTVSDLLDWRYNPSNSGPSWIKEGETHDEIIEITKTDNGAWDVRGYKRRLSDGLTRNNSIQCHKGFSTLKKAEHFVYKLFRGME